MVVFISNHYGSKILLPDFIGIFVFKSFKHNNVHTCHSERSEESFVSNPNMLRKVNEFFCEEILRSFLPQNDMLLALCKKISEGVRFW